jgi:hypothetical protein
MTTQGTIATVVLDDVDVTSLCTAGSVTKRLNRTSTASVTLNMQAIADVFGTQFPTAGSYLKIYLSTWPTNAGLIHHGRVLDCETTADENGGYTVFNSSDPFELWQHRPVRDDDGDFSMPTLLETYIFAPQTAQAMFNNSENTTTGGGGPPPTDAEGPLRMRLNSVEGGTVPIGADPTDWPMTMAEFASLLIGTGYLDLVCTPIEFDVSDNYGQLDIYQGSAGLDLHSSIAFQYGMGAYNIRALRWNEDMSNVCNKLWYYLGPKCDDQHWQANITGDEPAFNPNATNAGAWALATPYVDGATADRVSHGSYEYICITSHTSAATSEPGVGATWQDFWTYWRCPPGGRLSPPASSTNNPLGVSRYLSQQAYDVRMDIQVWDSKSRAGDGVDCVGNAGVVGQDLFRVLWTNESWIRNFPRNLVHITPTRDTEIGSFDIADLVLVEAASEVKGGFSGVQRIYEFTIAWDAEESVPALSELQVSSDQEGFN